MMCQIAKVIVNQSPHFKGHGDCISCVLAYKYCVTQDSNINSTPQKYYTGV